MDLPADVKKFDENLSKFLILMRTIIQTHEKRNLKLSSNKNPVLARLEKYVKTYDRTSPEEHVWYFNKIYDANRSAILRGPERDAWLKSGNITVQFGEEVGRITDIKIHLTIIYGTACKLTSDIEASLKGLPDVDQCEELAYPNLFLLYLYRIFYEIVDIKTEKEQLLQHVTELEKVTGTKSKSKNNDPLSGILGTVTDLMGQMGVKLPQGQKIPSQDELGKMLGTVMNNPQTKSLLGNVMQEMKDCKSLGDVVSKLVGNLGSAGMDTSVQQAVSSIQSSSNDCKEDEFLD